MKKYRIIYADPPWWYGGKTSVELQKTRIRDLQTRPEVAKITPSGCWYDHAGRFHNVNYGIPYRQMTEAELAVLPIRDLADKNCTLFCWATGPHLPTAFRLLDAWGFTYKHTLVWDKVQHNVSPYSFSNAEFLLIAGRGACKPQIANPGDTANKFKQIQVFDRGYQNSKNRILRHSEKPELFVTDYIDKFWPNGNRIELFARRARPGWDVWGNEAPGSVDIFEKTYEAVKE